MTKELSKKLCELCGIEPKIRYHVKIAGTVYKISKDNVLKHSGIFKNAGIKVGKVTKNYPDFTKPENFVKLLEIVSRIADVSFCPGNDYFRCIISYAYYGCSSVDKYTIQRSFLNNLLKQNLRNPCKPNFLEQIKQAIREAQWLYD